MNLAQQVIQWLHLLRSSPATINRDPAMDAVADWARMEPQNVEVLREFLASRIEARGALPIPSTSHDLAIIAGRDKECRELAQLLLFLAHSAPPSMASGSEQDGNEGVQH